jgi:UDP-N-acetylglucosamine 1-carboxyvinyltransferase
MGSFVIEGGHPLKGEIQPQGAKNEALQIVSAVLLTSDKIIINNIPEIRDVNKLIELIAGLGVKVEKLSEGSFSFQADAIDLEYMDSEEFRKKSRFS